MKTHLASICIGLAVVSFCFAAPAQPREGFVPDERTAVAIAVAVWTPIYGENQVAKEKPYVATLKDGVWTISGSLPPGFVGGGGVAMAQIAKADGRVIAVSHGR